MSMKGINEYPKIRADRRASVKNEASAIIASVADSRRFSFGNRGSFNGAQRVAKCNDPVNSMGPVKLSKELTTLDTSKEPEQTSVLGSIDQNVKKSDKAHKKADKNEKRHSDQHVGGTILNIQIFDDPASKVKNQKEK